VWEEVTNVSIVVLQPVLLGDGASSHVLGRLLSRVASIVRASGIAQVCSRCRALLPAC
jgi:hypothetical protein